ncbi:unnamed protein product [Rotaria sp. Silwood1]|nr:unnamed protein product [Rotaria sp. Silwood1]CAF1426891.1 unnamed protein product [Rotaria sp. Silwood1]CAF3569929.1 unnamed protein product [Rotaria sp. Silwood1]CAF3604590.1 unnamed protein product [Rotaria sp. Silwood1]CAF4834345.1 unnamed protein product [Rotaria sp. Silwood1]
MKKSCSNISTSTKRKSKLVTTECKICGGSAIYSHYGVISCRPCRMFFKRNAQQGKKVLKCDFHGNCKINVNNRHICSYCRLLKCFTNGMKTEMIRSCQTKMYKTNKKRKTMLNQLETASTTLVTLNQFEQFPTLNLLQSDHSTLNADQWSVISNLSHCYDEYGGLSRGERFMREQELLPPTMRYESPAVIDLIQMILHDGQSLYKTNQDFLSLSVDDRCILLDNTFEHTASLSSNFILYKIRLMDIPIYYNILESITNPDNLPAARRIAKRLNFDVIIMKLFLSILCFSTIGYTIYLNSPPINLSNIKEILRIQDKYTELTWRYLVYKYNYEWAIKCFSDLIRCFFAVNEAVVKTHEIQWFTNTIHSIVEDTELSLIVDD